MTIIHQELLMFWVSWEEPSQSTFKFYTAEQRSHSFFITDPTQGSFSFFYLSPNDQSENLAL